MSTPPFDFAGRAALGVDAIWRSRCEVAGIHAATDVMAEPTSTPGHTQRADYAFKFLNTPANMSGPLAVAVASQPGISGPEATDQDILFTTNSLWNAMSGYSAAGA